MESLSQWLKQWGPVRSKDLEQTYHEILNEPLIVKLRSKYPELTDDVMRIHMSRLYQCVKEYRNCQNCPGLDECPNDYPGHYTKLTVDSVNGTTLIHDRKAVCDKLAARKKQDTIRSRIRSYYVDERALLEGYSIDEIITTDPKRAPAVDRVVDYILKTKEEGLLREGLFLSGGIGTGKTFLMCYLLHELAKDGLTGVIVYMPEFVEEIKSLIHEPEKLKETIELFKQTDLLVFDDIGAENLTPWVRDHVLGAILNYRMNRKPTFYTSNFDLDGLEKHFSFTSKDGEEEYKGRRLMDRIRHFVQVVEVHGENKRERKFRRKS